MRDRDHTLAVRAVLYAMGGLLLLASPFVHGAEATRVLDDFEDASRWSVFSSTQVTGVVRPADGVQGKGLCLDYDFHGVSGYVGIRRALPLDYPADYAFDFQLRGDSPQNNLEFKLVDASGDNVWWVQRANYVFPKDWTQVRYRKRHVSKAWGPSPEKELRHSASLEFTLASGTGGKGSVCFDQLRFTPLEPDDGSPLTATRKLDKNTLVLDLGRRREFGGLTLQWPEQNDFPYDIALSDDGIAWREIRRVLSNEGTDWVALPESDARYLRVALLGSRDRKALKQVQATIEPLAFGASTNDFLMEVAKRTPRGDWPRGFSGEQVYWTIVGVDGGREQALISEDGAIELGKGGPSVEPFVLLDGKRVSWADVESQASLEDGYLPIPTVEWKHPQFGLRITAADVGDAAESKLIARYRLENRSGAARDFDLVLAMRPLQVNPPSQFLNTRGGWSPAYASTVDFEGGWLDPEPGSTFRAGPRSWHVRLAQRSNQVAAFDFDHGDLAAELAQEAYDLPDGITMTMEGPGAEGLAGILWRFRMHLQPGEARDFYWLRPGKGGESASITPADAQHALAATALQWHRKLDAVKFTVPAQGQQMLESLRYALATMLVSRTGPRLQPGTRSYSRAWIRDGAMIDEALLRLGREDVARDFVDWYAPYQFKDGKVPCCVDDRGSDPVPENDSHGELVYAIAEVYRYTRDRAFLERHWPRVRAAAAYMDQLRASERTPTWRSKNPAFFGLMPASISHEGYSAKPMHSYWDDFWALRGYKDAVRIAQWLGQDAEAKRLAASRDEFATDLRASLAHATSSKSLDFIPGSAELGDFDPTSTTIALAPADAADLLPPGLLMKSFERYWGESQSRAKGTRAWKDYTPYELRTVGTFVRLGQPERAHAMLDFFFKDQQPAGWRQWAEVVSNTPRKPFFLGDLPHAWVASDYARSVLDLFAYERSDELVLAGGIPLDWLDGDGVAVDGLRTPYGKVSYSLRREGQRLHLELRGDAAPPRGLRWALPHRRVRAAQIDGRTATPEHDELELPAGAKSAWVDLAD